MSAINLTKKSIKVSYEGKDYLVAKPTTKQINDFSKANDKSIEGIVGFLELLGLPTEISWNIDAESMQEIVEALIPKVAEKKS
jgi:hypothetical protein